jgi:small subunit ribosomal protein S4
MGDTKKFVNKYSTPSHPWRLDRIEPERALRREYGLKNSRELWKVASKLKNMKDQIKGFATMAPAQGALEREQLAARLKKYGMMPEDNDMQAVLGYNTKILLDRRLQTVLVRKGLCGTMRQARQFIVHRHILVGDKCITAPGYLVPITEESQITFKANSSLADEQHPERLSKEDAAKKRAEEKEAKRKLDAATEVEEEVVQLEEGADE